MSGRVLNNRAGMAWAVVVAPIAGVLVGLLTQSLASAIPLGLLGGLVAFKIGRGEPWF